MVLAQSCAMRERAAALRSAVTTAQESLHTTEIVSREALDREVRQLCEDLEVEIGQIEAKLAEIRSVDMSEAKRQALRQALRPQLHHQ